MNLRKLLCGLLALCLLMTMVPVALMEEIEPAVGEVDLVLGEDADDLYVIGDEDTDLTTSSDLTVKVGASKELTLPCDIASKKNAYDEVEYLFKSSDKKIATVEMTAANKIKITGVKAGDAQITVQLKDPDIAQANAYIVNVTVVAENPRWTKWQLFDEMDVKIDGTTQDVEVYEYPAGYLVTANFYDKDGKGANNSLYADEIVIWEVSNDKAKIDGDYWKKDEVGKTDAHHRTAKISMKKTGKVKITATNSRTGETKSFTLKIADSYKPKSVKVEVKRTVDKAVKNNWNATTKTMIFPAGGEGEDYALELEATVNGDDTLMHEVTWKVSDKKIATIEADKDDSHTAILTPVKAGKVKVTATTYNDKKAEIEITFANAADTYVDMYLVGSYTKAGMLTSVAKCYDDAHMESKEDANLYWNFDYSTLYIAPVFTKANYKKSETANRLYTNGEAAADPTLKNITWTSDKTSVATVTPDKKSGFAKINIKKTGTVTITAKKKVGNNVLKESVKLTVKVNNKPSKILFLDENLNPISSYSMKVGEKAVLPVYLVGKDGKPAMTTLKAWSHHTSIATVKENKKSPDEGKIWFEIKAVRKGNVKIEVKTGNGMTKTLTIKITK